MINHKYMQRALALAAKGKGRTSPNPMVGAVIVKNGRVIAEGYHRKAGTPHAEVVALRKAGAKAKGATLYVNLEPCCHTDKKTPPCTKAIIQSGISKVVIATQDPNPKVSGRGIKELKKAGVKTETGIMSSEAQELNKAFIKFITKKEPFVILKIAQSLDGKIATAKGESKWITGEKARNLVHKLRNEVDAVLVGINTVKKDNPSLDCRIRGGRNPYRIIVDSRLEIPLDSKVLKFKDDKTIIATIPSILRSKATAEDRPASHFTKRGYQKKTALLRKHGCKVLVVKGPIRKKTSTTVSNGVNLKALMKALGKLDISSVMIEGGSSINASALADGIVDNLMIFIAPMIIGGTDSISSIGGKSPAQLGKTLRLKNLRINPVGQDILIQGDI